MDFEDTEAVAKSFTTLWKQAVSRPRPDIGKRRLESTNQVPKFVEQRLSSMAAQRLPRLCTLLKAMRHWLKDRTADGSDFVFVSQKGGRMHRSQFFRIFQACAETAGLPRTKWHPHVLKHSLATHLIARKCQSGRGETGARTQEHR
jgi:integrase